MFRDKKAVLFDLDGTLVDSMWVWSEIDVEFLGSRGLLVPPDLERAVDGMGFTEVAYYFKERFRLPESIEEIKEQWLAMSRDKYIYEVPLKKGVAAILPLLKEQGLKLAVVSSNSRELVEAVLASHDISGYFDCIVTACDVNKGKPAPDVYLKAAKDLGIRPEECLVFEDIPEGILAGKAAHMVTCAVYDDYSRGLEIEKRKLADYYIDSFEDLISAAGRCER